MLNDSYSDFSWLSFDVTKSLMLRVFISDSSEHSSVSIFDPLGVYDTNGNALNVRFANIDDITNLLTIGIVKFYDVTDSKNILIIPFRNLFKLLDNACYMDDSESLGRGITLSSVDGFSSCDVLEIEPYVLSKLSDDLLQLVELAKNYGNMDMQEKYDALYKANEINYRRVKSDSLN